MEKIEKFDSRDDLVRYQVDGAFVEEMTHSHQSHAKKSTYSTVSDGEELFLEHAQGINDVHIMGADPTGQVEIVHQGVHQSSDIAVSGQPAPRPLPPPPPPPPAAAGNRSAPGSFDAPQSGSFRRNIQNESLAVDAMLDDIVEHMATPLGPDEDELYK